MASKTEAKFVKDLIGIIGISNFYKRKPFSINTFFKDEVLSRLSSVTSKDIVTRDYYSYLHVKYVTKKKHKVEQYAVILKVSKDDKAIYFIPKDKETNQLVVDALKSKKVPKKKD